MRAWEFGLQDGVSSWHLADRPRPIPQPGETLIKVHAACLNHRDLLALRGAYGQRKPKDRIPLSDGVGHIEEINGDTHGLAVGQRVISPHFATWIEGEFSPSVFANDVGVSRDGWLADYIILPTSALVRVPDRVSDEIAATLAAAGTTAWHGLVTFGKIQPNDVVLTLGTGGVSMFALQIAKALGARVAITSSSDEKLLTCKKLGADIVINYRDRPDWEAVLLEETEGRGASLVVDTTGFSSLDKTVAAAAPNARIAMIGALDTQSDRIPNLFGIIGKNITLKGITSGSKAMLEELVAFVELENMAGSANRVFTFEQATDACNYLREGSHMGKVMITL